MNDPETISDEALMGHLVQGDAFALQFLYKRHSRFLCSLALRITGDSEGAEEVVQDTFFQLWRKSSQFDSARGSLVGWLLTITRHGAICHIRQHRDRFHCESLCDDAKVLHRNIGSTVLQQHVARELVSAALAGLPKVQREAITLAYFDGWTCEEIAARTRTPLGTIKTRLRSALKTMKRVLSNPRFTRGHTV